MYHGGKECDRMEALKKQDIYTIEDIYLLPDGARAELIDGQIYYMAPPSLTHQRISSYLHGEIYNYIKKNNGECEVFSAPFAVFLSEDSKNYVEPDLFVICDKNKLSDKGCNGAPDWMIEIVSPGSRRMDYFLKLFKYRSAGVKEYWIVDFIKQRVTVYKFADETIEEYSFGEAVPVGIFGGFSIEIKGE